MRLNLKRILLVVAVSITTLIEANAMSGSKIENFKFKDYKTEDAAKEALLEIHPIGSNADLLIETLRKSGADETKTIFRDKIKQDDRWKGYFNKTIRISQTEYKSTKVSSLAIKAHFYQKSTGIIFNTKLWKVSFWSDKNNNITDLAIIRDYTGL
ncbi:MAG: hypothetical protein HON42_02425 [Alphaproteobacteria bacterium]|jgi:hypothetical protein|nr:hypothetical protein [Alphaproteobacteria bacterium]